MKDYDTTVARMAGNIAAGLTSQRRLPLSGEVRESIVKESVDLSLAIVKRIRDLGLHLRPTKE